MEHSVKRCLFISDRSFYSYSEKIEKELLFLGYNLTVFNHEYPDSNLGKILSKLHISTPLRVTRKIISTKLLKGEKYDLVIIIKGRGISLPLILQLKQFSDKVIGYNYDSFDFNSGPLSWYRHADKYCTFDYRDADLYQLPVVELFSSLSYKNHIKKVKYELSAIIRNHSERMRYIDRILSAIPNTETYIYIYDINIFTFILNFIKNPGLILKYSKYIHFKSLSYQEYSEVLCASNITIDYVYASQTGISLRCFEALASQTKIITNNPFIIRNNHFNDKNTIVFENSTSTDKLRERYYEIRNITPESYCRTITHFITDLIS